MQSQRDQHNSGLRIRPLLTIIEIILRSTPPHTRTSLEALAVAGAVLSSQHLPDRHITTST
jgi:hypothetical protein